MFFDELWELLDLVPSKGAIREIRCIRRRAAGTLCMPLSSTTGTMRHGWRGHGGSEQEEGVSAFPLYFMPPSPTKTRFAIAPDDPVRMSGDQLWGGVDDSPIHLVDDREFVGRSPSPSPTPLRRPESSTPSHPCEPVIPWDMSSDDVPLDVLQERLQTQARGTHQSLEELLSSDDTPLNLLGMRMGTGGASVESESERGSEPEDDQDNHGTTRAREVEEDNEHRTPRGKSFGTLFYTPGGGHAVQVGSDVDDCVYTPQTEKKVQDCRAIEKRLKSVAEGAQLKADEAEAAKEEKCTFFEEILNKMYQEGYSLADFLEYIFNPENTHRRDYRWSGFFKKRGAVRAILGYWWSANASMKTILGDWAYDQMVDDVSEEGDNITNDGMLRTRGKTINGEFFSSFTLSGMTRRIRAKAPKMFGLAAAFSSTPRQEREMSEDGLQHQEIIQGSALISLLKARSMQNSMPGMVLGTYLMVSGAQRQTFSVLNSMGISAGYDSIISSGDRLKSDSKSSVHSETVPASNLERAATSDEIVPTHIAVVERGVPDECTTAVNQVQSTVGHTLPVSTAVQDDLPEDNQSMLVEVLAALSSPSPNASDAYSETAGPLQKDTSVSTSGLTQAGGERTEGDPSRPSSATPSTTSSTWAFRLDAPDVVMPAINPSEDEQTGALSESSQLEESGEVAVAQAHDHADEQPLAPAPKRRSHPPGVLSRLSEACREDAHDLAATHLFAGVYDNINLMIRVAEQIIGRKNAQENGTCATIFPLFDAALDDMHMADVEEAIMTTPPLTIQDIELTDDEATLYEEFMVHTILRIIITHGGNALKKWEPRLKERQPHSNNKIPLHTSKLLPLPAMEIEEASIVGNITVLETIYDELHLDTKTDGFQKYAKIVAGDQLTIARQHAILNIRLGHEDGSESWKHIVLMPDIVQDLRDERQLAEKINEAGAKQTTKRSRKATTGSTHTPSPAPIPGDDSRGGLKAGDMVFENGLLFIRDALHTRAFADAIKAGDSGQVIIILKIWVYAYRGSGRTKYAHEMLHLIHNLVNVWPAALRDIIIKNWLQNPTGKEEGWVERVYKADGDAHSWDWLAMIAPCIEVLRHLARSIHAELGSYQGDKHTSPDLRRDVDRLMTSLDIHNVYRLQNGRQFDSDEQPAPDIIAVGAAALTHGTSTNPLADFNAQCELARERRRLKPVTELLELLKPDHPLRAALFGSPENNTRDHASPVASHEAVTVEPVIEASATPVVSPPRVDELLVVTEDGNWEDLSDGESMTSEEQDSDEEVEATLPRTTADDVALDMDIFAVEEGGLGEDVLDSW
ncbi:hypothetical protein OF83DRAFT_1088874 [Amylostereum chailletii]|nr:hypothetical protein OF83DRAFT_1088874 [Amylostereum chailletii]